MEMENSRKINLCDPMQFLSDNGYLIDPKNDKELEKEWVSFLNEYCVKKSLPKYADTYLLGEIQLFEIAVLEACEKVFFTKKSLRLV